MKIAFDYQIFASQRFGGVSRYFFEIASHLSKCPDQIIECQVNSPLYINEYLRHARGKLNVRGVPVPGSRYVSRVYREISRLVSPISLRRWEPDIVHETYYAPKSVSPSKSRIVLTVYDMIHELYPEYFPERDRTAQFKKASVDRADRIICVSENTKTDLIRFLDVDSEKISVVHLGFALTSIGWDSPPIRDRAFILYVGNRAGYKNFYGLLEAYASYTELRERYDLLAFGGGPFTRQEIAMIRELGLSLSQVHQIGGDDAVLGTFYRQAEMFVYPSLYEGFGIPPLEAMAFDCPVACSNTSSMPEVVGDGAIQFDPLDVSSIANALICLSSEPGLRQSLIERGRARVSRFSWERCASQTLDVYRSLL